MKPLAPNPSDLLVPTESGLYCQAGDFYIDPWRPVPSAVITHAHADHAIAGCQRYICSPTCAFPLAARLGHATPIQTLPFEHSLTLHSTRISLHPAGHILGAAQVRVERSTPLSPSPVWVVSGDYKVARDRTCESFSPVPCDVFITESTFGLPIYRWREQAEVFQDINAWWAANAAASRTSLLLTYSLGKAQRLLAGLDPSIGPIACHGAVERMNQAYQHAGIQLPPTTHALEDTAQHIRGRGLLLAPPSVLGTTWPRRFTHPDGGISTAMASGWMLLRGRRRWQAVDRGFVLSDHADWPGLMHTIKATGASRIGVTHGAIKPMVRWLTEQGLDAFEVPTRYMGEGESPPEEAEAAGAS